MQEQKKFLTSKVTYQNDHAEEFRCLTAKVNVRENKKEQQHYTHDIFINYGQVRDNIKIKDDRNFSTVDETLKYPR